MKLRNLLITLGLTLTVGVGVAVATEANSRNKIFKEADALIQDGYNCITGSSDALDGWANAGKYTMTQCTVDGSNFYYYKSLSLKNGTEFKITNKTWTNAKGASLVENKSSGTFGGSDNIVCSTAGNYDIAWNGSKIYIWDEGGIDPSYIGWVVAGEGTTFSGPNWSPGSSLHMTTPGDGTDVAKLSNVSMVVGDKFRIAYSVGYKFNDDGWKSWGSVQAGFSASGDNLEVTVSGSVNIFLNSGYTGYAFNDAGTSSQSILITSSASGTTGTPYPMKDKSTTETVTKNAVYIEKGQYVRRCWDGTPYNTWYDGGADSCFENVDGNSAVLCKMTGVYTIYNQAGSTSSWWNIWTERHEELSAGFLAQKFNSAISTICSGIIGGSKSLSDLQAAWGSNTSSALYYHFNGQPSDTMDYFKTNASTTNTDILACIAKYDYIVKKYGTTALPDFLSRNNGYTAAGQQSHILISLFGQSGSLNNGILVAVVISSLGILSVGAYFFFKKSKKSEE